MKLLPVSHVDHGLSTAQLSYLLERFGDHQKFFLVTVELPAELGTVPCGLFGPLVGDPPIADSEVVLARRGDRAWVSRLVDREPRQTNLVSIIAGPHEGEPCVVYTIFGGPISPREPADIRQEMERLHRERGALPDRSPENAEHSAIYARIEALRESRTESDVFWRDHALATPR